MKLLILLACAALATAKAPMTLTEGADIRKLYNELGDVPRNSAKSIHPGRVFEIPETALNQFAADLVREKGSELKSARLELIDDKVIVLTASGRLDWKQVFKAKGDGMTAKILAHAGGMESTLTAKLSTASAKRMAYFRVLSIKIDGITLPQSLVDELISYIGSKQRPPQDYTRLFPLPYGIQKIEVRKGLLVVHL